MTTEPIQPLAVDLPHLPQHPTLEQVADFLIAYGQMSSEHIASAVAAKFPALKVDPGGIHAIAAGWLAPQMEFAACALRQYVADRERWAS